MSIVHFYLNVNYEPTEEEKRKMREEYEAAKKLPRVEDPECPFLTKDDLSGKSGRYRRLKPEERRQQYSRATIYPNGNIKIVTETE